MTHPMPPKFRRFVEFLAANPSPVDVVAGKFYWVPCATLEGVQWRHGIKQKHIPLLGTLHEDKDIIKFKPWHIHVDTRFLTTEPYFSFVDRNSLQTFRGSQWILSAPLCLEEPSLRGDRLTRSKWINADLSLRKLKARRPEPAEWPERRFQQELEDAYAHTSAACGICPHRQIPLSAGRDLGNGVRQCPGHGLCWDSEGRMVRQALISEDK